MRCGTLGCAFSGRKVVCLVQDLLLMVFPCHDDVGWVFGLGDGAVFRFGVGVRVAEAPVPKRESAYAHNGRLGNHHYTT